MESSLKGLSIHGIGFNKSNDRQDERRSNLAREAGRAGVQDIDSKETRRQEES